MNKKASISAVFMILCVLNSYAVFDTIKISEVSITAQVPLEERGSNFSIIDTFVLRRHMTGSLSDLLSSNSGIYIKNYGQGALSTISFRGTSATHTKVNWNGLTLNNPMVGQVDFSLIPVNFTDRITLYQGGSSLHDGSGALGGSIKLESIPSWNKSKLMVSQGTGSFGTYRSLANIQYGKGRALLRLKLFHERSENNFDYYNTENGLWNYEIQENAGYRKNGIVGEIFLKPNVNNIVSLHSWIQRSKRNLPSIMSYQGPGREENQADRQLRFSGVWKHYGENFRSETILGFTSAGIDYYLANLTGLGTYVNFNSHSNTQTIVSTQKVTVDLGTGLALKSQLNYIYSSASILDEKTQQGYHAGRNELGWGASLHREVFQHLSVFGLLRAELADWSWSPLMPSVGLESNFPERGIKIRSNLTRNYHLPTLNDLYWIPGGNPDLKPEEGYSGDLSFSHIYKKDSYLELSSNVNLYISSINDWILWRPGDFGYWTAENIATVDTRGAELNVSGNYHPGEWDLSLSANYSYTRTLNRSVISSDDNSADRQLIYVPVHKGNISFNSSLAGYHLMLSSVYVGERYTTSSNEMTRHTLPEFLLFDIRAGKEIKLDRFKVSVQLRVDNLLNKDYKAILSRPMPGRSWELALKLEL